MENGLRMGILEMTNCEEGMKIRMISDEKKVRDFQRLGSYSQFFNCGSHPTTGPDPVPVALEAGTETGNLGTPSNAGCCACTTWDLSGTHTLQSNSIVEKSEKGEYYTNYSRLKRLNWDGCSKMSTCFQSGEPWLGCAGTLISIAVHCNVVCFGRLKKSSPALGSTGMDTCCTVANCIRNGKSHQWRNAGSVTCAWFGGFKLPGCSDPSHITSFTKS